MKRNLSLLLLLCIVVLILASASGSASAITPTKLAGSSLTIKLFTDAGLTSEVTDTSTVFPVGSKVYVVPYVTVPKNSVSAFDISIEYDSTKFTFFAKGNSGSASKILEGDRNNTPSLDITNNSNSTTEFALAWTANIADTSFGIAYAAYTVSTTATAATFKFKAVPMGEMADSTGNVAYSFESTTSFLPTATQSTGNDTSGSVNQGTTGTSDDTTKDAANGSSTNRVGTIYAKDSSITMILIYILQRLFRKFSSRF